MKQRHAGRDEVYERRFRRRDGSSLWTLVSAKVLKDDQGRFLGSFAMFTDITERKRTDESLRESEARFRGYFELGQVAMAITSIEKGWVQFNDRLCDILGYPREELSRLTWTELTYPDDLEADVAQFDRVLRGEIDAYRMEKRFIRKDGEVIHALISAQCVRRADGQIDHFVAMVDDITEQKQAEQALSQNNLQLQKAVSELERARNMLRLIIESIPVRVFWKDKELRYLGCNRLFARDGGFQHPQELFGKDDFAMGWREQAELYRKDDRQVMESGLSRTNIIEPQKTPAGTTIWLSTSKVPLCLPDGEVFGILGIYEDITDRKQAEVALRKSEEKHRSILRAASIGIGVVVDRILTEVNDYLCNMTGYSKEELLGKNARVLYPTQEHYETVGEEKYRQITETGTGTVETQWKRKDGVVLDILLSSTPIDRDDLSSGVTFTALDITERKRAEDALRTSEERFRSLVESSSDWIWEVDAQGRYTHVSSKVREILGYAPAEVIGRSPSDLMPEEEAGRVEAIFSEIAAHRRPFSLLENVNLHRDGRRIVMETSGVPVFGSEGEFMGYRGMDRDITERKVVEESLRESEEKFRTLFETMSEGVFYQGLDGAFLDANPAAMEMLGLTLDELLGRTLYDLSWDVIHEKGTKCSMEEYPSTVALRTGKPVMGVVLGVFNPLRKSYVWMAVSAIPQFRQGEAVPYRVYVTLHDLTQRKLAAEAKEKLESQLRHTQKLEAIGTLAGGIAHDFNNILSPIIGYTEMAMDSIEESSTSRYDLDQVLIAANRAKDLVRQILSFSRLGEEQLMRPVDMGLIVKEALKLLRASLPSTIEIRQDIHKVTVVADATQIHQVVVNLCTNAAHAMEDMGILDMSLQEVHLSAQNLAELAIADLKPGKYLKLSVKDTGTGMSSDTLQRIFDPYFTTKEVGKGTGLGLAVVHGIVKRHGGEILVKSELGKGTVFEVLIPVVESKLKRDTSGSQVLPKGSERILLVDDESPIATMGARILEPLGYKVTAMTSPKEALDLFRSQPDQFDLIITDYTMPQMVGTQLANECRRIRAEMPVIICTGHSERLNRAEPEQIGADAVAMKPLDRKQLAMIVRDVLDKATN
jgi:two-component system, cell cycle sensor histidine kinase and response regulator CckA